MNNEQKLFDGFKPPSDEDWNKVVKNEVKKTELNWSTYENIPLNPIYNQKDLNQLTNKKLFQHNLSTGWKYIDGVKVKDATSANQIALTSLEGGSDGICFTLTEAEPNWKVLLNGIWLDQCVISFDYNTLPAKSIGQFLEFYLLQGKTPSELRGWINWDPLKVELLYGEKPKNFQAQLKSLFDITYTYPKFKTLTVNSHHFINSGANIIQELAYTLSVTVEYIEALKYQKIGADSVLKKSLFSLTVGTNFFFEISKLRAFRILVCKVAKAYNLSIFPSDVEIHIQTSLWNKSNLDHHNNTIRNTAEALAGVIGGANYLSINNIVPQESEENLSQRTSRNISHILREEAYMDKVADPAAGSYYIESLTEAIEQEAWKLFLEIERLGGFTKAVEKGKISTDINKLKDEKIKNLDLRKDLLIGTNIYPNHKEQAENREQKKRLDQGSIHEQMVSEGIEELRCWVETSYENERLKVLLVNLSPDEKDKNSISLLSSAFSSAGFKVDQYSVTFPEKELMRKEYNFAVFFLNNSTTQVDFITENFRNAILTSSTPLSLSKENMQIYEPVDRLVLHQNLKRILSHYKNVSK